MNTKVIAHCQAQGTVQASLGRVLRIRAFTRAELLVILATLALLAVVVLPALAGSRPRTNRVACANNLRQIGIAFQLWGNDRGDRVPFEVPVAEGGTRMHSLAPNVWLHFSWMSNEMASAKILACPDDARKRVARDFSMQPATGYLHGSFRNSATSYLLSHTFTGLPPGLLAADRNFAVDGSAGCNQFVFSAYLSGSLSFPSRASWTSALHQGAGNALFLDGRLEQVTTQGLREAINFARNDNGTLHVLLP
jgi:prepilin-type processing-associated H-X9-DG protein